MNIISVCHQNLLVSGHKKAAELVLHCKQLPSTHKISVGHQNSWGEIHEWTFEEGKGGQLWV